MKAPRQTSDNWLDPFCNARITYHDITWHDKDKFEFIQTGGDLYFHKVPKSGTFDHCHDFAEIIIITGGSLEHRVNSDRQSLTAGDIVFMRPDDIHCFAPSHTSDKVELILLDFDLELFLSLSIFFENDLFLQQLTTSVLPPLFKLSTQYLSELSSSLLKLNNPTTTAASRKIKLKMILAELFSKYFLDETRFLSESQIPDWLEELCLEMRKEKNFCQGIDRMQKLAYRTPGHLCKSFKRYLHKTPTDFINELKLNHAAHLLSDSDIDILGVAEKLQFQSLSRFYHLFKKYYGITPALYRKQKRGNKF